MMQTARLDNQVWKFLSEISVKKGITEVIINNRDNVYVEREGELIRLDVNFLPEHIVNFCKDVALINRKSFNANYPILDGVLPDGSRINIVSSTYTGTSPAITIRKYLAQINSFDADTTLFGMSERWVTFFKTLALSKQNIIVSGGTGAGKTTFLNLLLQEIPLVERIVTIEDTKELQIKLPNVVRLVTQANSTHLEKTLTTRDLLRNTLRMRPDRIIIGEVRGEEAFDLLQAMNTGHSGSMCTIHANSPSQALSRLENLFLFAGYDVPIRAVRGQMSDAIDFILQLGRVRDGSRVIEKVTEVSNMEGDRVLLQDIGKYENGKLQFTGLVPKRIKKLMEYDLSSDFFLHDGD